MKIRYINKHEGGNFLNPCLYSPIQLSFMLIFFVILAVFWHFMGHEPVELVPSLVPLDAVEVVAVQVVAAHQVRGVPGLHIPGDPEVDLTQALKFWGKEGH